MLKTLAAYEEEVQTREPKAEASGIECPECKEELSWGYRSLICVHPPMRRVNCENCGFSKVIRVHG